AGDRQAELLDAGTPQSRCRLDRAGGDRAILLVRGHLGLLVVVSAPTLRIRALMPRPGTSLAAHTGLLCLRRALEACPGGREARRHAGFRLYHFFCGALRSGG